MWFFFFNLVMLTRFLGNSVDAFTTSGSLCPATAGVVVSISLNRKYRCEQMMVPSACCCPVTVCSGCLLMSGAAAVT